MVWPVNLRMQCVLNRVSKRSRQLDPHVSHRLKAENGDLQMALERPDPPESSRLEAVEGLRQSRKKTLAAEVSGGAPPVVSDPHQVFTLDPKDITAGAGLEAARAVGWRYLAGQAQGIASGGSSPSPTVVAEVTEQDGVPRFSHRQEGWLAKQTRETRDIAAKIPEVSS